MSTTTIIIKPMSKKELMNICDCSRYQLNKSLLLIKKTNKTFGEYRGNTKLSRTQVEIFLIHSDITPKEIQIQ